MKKAMSAYFPLGAAALAMLLMGIAARPCSGQVPTHALASLTSAGQLQTLGAVADEDLLHKSDVGREGEPWLTTSSWGAWLGDFDGDGVWDIPGDIDAISLIDPHAPPIPSGLIFSLLQDQGPYKDGDLLRRRPDGSLEVYLSEASLKSALGTTSSSIDVDAVAIGPGRETYFSLASNLASSSLGALLDGDILCLDSTGTVTRIVREADLQQVVDAVHGHAMAAVLDCIALAFDPRDDVLCFVPQAPSSIDASAYRLTGQAVAGFAESDWGFAGAAEIDALTFYQAPLSLLPRLRLVPDLIPAAHFATCEISGGSPGGLFFLIAGGRAGELSAPGLGGFASLLIDPRSAAYGQLVGRWFELIGIFDGLGRARFQLGAGFLQQPPFDLVVHAVDLSTGSISTPAGLHLR